jgi:hypothetical protein
VDKQVEEWQIEGVTRPSSSEYARPIVLVNTKDGTKRLCVDYRRLNKEIVEDRFPLPLIEDQMDRLSGAMEVPFGLSNSPSVLRSAEDARIRELVQQAAIEMFNDGREELRHQAKDQLGRAAEEGRRTFNKKRKTSEKYAAGYLVAIRRTQFGSGLKLSPKFLGPYEVVAVQGNDRYAVQKCVANC